MCTVTMVVFTKVYTAKGVGLRLHAHMLRSACGDDCILLLWIPLHSVGRKGRHACRAKRE